jgi:ABC-type antimicrobial peptide transport system permease subunit
MKQQIWAVDPLQSIFHTALVEDLVSQTLVGLRFSLLLLGGFAVATLLLAVAGVYGVMSFATSQRTREFGVRIALGAGRTDIMWLVLGEGVKLAGLGVLGGILLALPAMRLLQALLFGVDATDLPTFLSVSLALVLVAGAASYVPARRALKIAAVEALRPE